MQRGIPTITAAAAALALAATPAGAQSAVSFADACGDAQRIVGSPQFDLDVGLPRTARHDIKRTTVSPLVEDETVTGVRIALEVCGAIPAPEQIGSYWSVSAVLPDGCTLTASLHDELTIAGSSHRVSGLGKICTRPVDLPDPLPDAFETDERFSTTLPAGAVTVSGATITWTLRRADVAGEALEALANGVVWKSLETRTRDQARGTEFYDGTTGVSANGPGAADQSSTPQPFTIG